MPLLVPQFLTERALRERLLELGQRAHFGVELAGFTQDQRGVTAQLVGAHGEQTVRARYLIGADGGRSVVRHALGVGFPGKTLQVRAIVADLALTGLSRDVWHRFGEGDMTAQLALCPLAGGESFQLQAPVPLEGEIDLSRAGLNALIAERTRRDGIHVHAVSWASAYQMNARLADHYHSGRVFLVGDAAHVHPPTGGQGLNTSVQDAYNLAWKLAAVLNDAAPDTLLDSYEEERRPIAASLLGLSTKLLEAMKRGDLRRGRETKQLDLAYPESSLALEQPTRGARMFAGHRAPDVLLLGAAGQPRRLFELFQETHWTLPGYGAARDQIAARPGLHLHTIGGRGELIDAHGQMRDTYGMREGDWLLVRPDGYIGAIVTSDRLTALAPYFASVGLRA